MSYIKLYKKEVKSANLDPQIEKNIKLEEQDMAHLPTAVKRYLRYTGSVGKSNDRFESADGKVYKNYPWRTPVKEYDDFNGYCLPSKADVIWEHPDGDFCYGKFEMEEIIYNKIILQ